MPMMEAFLPASYSPTRIPAETPSNNQRLALAEIYALGVLVGIIGGLGAVVFRDLIGLVHNLLFLDHLNLFYDASIFAPASP